MKRTLYIGDIHGCADEFERIIDAFGFVRGTDTLYQTGDCINKGPDMMRCIRLVEELGILTVRGNHEEHLLRMMTTPRETWTDKQRARFDRLPLEDWEYIKSVVEKWPLWRDTEHALLVHAGLEPGKTRLEEMDPKVILSVRIWNDRPWYEQVAWPKKIVFGHWAANGFVQGPGYIGLDSGCVYGKKLTAWCPEEDKFYVVPAAREYTPVKGSEKTAQEAPCIIPEENKTPPKFSESIKNFAPSLVKEWSGYKA